MTLREMAALGARRAIVNDMLKVVGYDDSVVRAWTKSVLGREVSGDEMDHIPEEEIGLLLCDLRATRGSA